METTKKNYAAAGAASDKLQQAWTRQLRGLASTPEEEGQAEECGLASHHGGWGMGDRGLRERILPHPQYKLRLSF